ncbi:anti-sigma factor domain-containing protein [Bacillus thuringiensis]|uniref:anti-sigma factor domain-containing protein n=1 Tax=Bacillus thuringiensis TaxID=1428 RepID=UPI0021D65F31|nr:anti-sigma factor domain-containing protein [Bacillus thuringiensis]MCU7667286.1 anti-sigma factor domain-containing protein [Bacillus thuringiensis]
MKQGLILEINKKYMIVAVSGADIIRAEKIDGAQVGDEVYFEPYQENKLCIRLLFKRLWGSTLVKCLPPGRRIVYLMINFIVIGSFVIPSYKPQASTYVSIDTLSSIEIDLDDEMKILGIRGYNKQGKKLAKDLAILKGKDVEELMEVAISHRKTRGLINEQYQPCIVVTKTSRTADEDLEKLNKVTQEISVRDGFRVRYQEKDEKFRDEALYHKLTPGRYNVFLTAKKQGVDVTVKSVREISLVKFWMLEKEYEKKNGEKWSFTTYIYCDDKQIHNMKNSYFA